MPFLPTAERAGPEQQACSGRQRNWLQEKALGSQKPEEPFFLGLTDLCPSNQAFALGEVRGVWVSPHMGPTRDIRVLLWLPGCQDLRDLG